MSDPTNRPRQEVDRILTGRIVAIGLGALAVFAVGIWWAASVERSASGSLRNVTAPAPDIGQVEIGMVYQLPFTEPLASLEARRELRSLQETGWADSRRRTLHIPIQRAMDLTVQRGWPKR